MLHLLYGNDIEKRKVFLEKSSAKLISLGYTPLVMSDVDFRQDFFEMLARGSELFGGKSFLVLNATLENTNTKEIVAGLFKEMASSENEFFLIENKATKEIIAKCEKAGGDAVSFEESKTKAKPNFSIFSLADAFGQRDRKSAWLMLREAFDKEIAPEEVHGVLFWELKTLLLAHNESGESEMSSGLNPFVYKKAKNFSKSFTRKELENMSGKMVRLYHDAHRGILDLETGLELFLLKSL